jgi:hypothetical protein
MLRLWYYLIPVLCAVVAMGIYTRPRRCEIDLAVLSPSYAAASRETTALSLAGLNLTCLPATAFAAFPRLTVLDLSHNAFRSTDDIPLSALPRLQTLYLEFNALTTLGHVPWPLPALSLLNLSHNQLTDLGTVLYHAIQLQWLSATHNRLVDIPAGATAERHAELLWVDAAYNNITHADMAVFNTTARLQRVDLRHNKLVVWRPPVSMPRDAQLLLDANPIQCPVTHQCECRVGFQYIRANDTHTCTRLGDTIPAWRELDALHWGIALMASIASIYSVFLLPTRPPPLSYRGGVAPL